MISAAAIYQRRQLFGQELRAVVYVSETEQRIIVAPTYVNKAGIHYEQEAAIELPLDVAFERLGLEVKSALTACALRDTNLKYARIADWAALKLSNARSERAFRARYVRVSVETINATLKIEGNPIKYEEIFVGGYLFPACDDDALGQLIVRVFWCCQHLTEVSAARDAP